MVLSPGRIDHQEACLTQGIRIVIHEDPVVSGPLMSPCALGICSEVRLCWTYRSLPLLRTSDEDIASELVCHFLRDRTLSSMSVLIVG